VSVVIEPQADARPGLGAEIEGALRPAPGCVHERIANRLPFAPHRAVVVPYRDLHLTAVVARVGEPLPVAQQLSLPKTQSGVGRRGPPMGFLVGTASDMDC